MSTDEPLASIVDDQSEKLSNNASSQQQQQQQQQQDRNESSYNNNPTSPVIEKHGPKNSSISNLFNNLDDENETKVPNESTLSCDNDISSQSIYQSGSGAGMSDRSKTDADVEKFGGKIVYNPDGSAYIIDDSNLSDDDSLIALPKHEGSIVERSGQDHDEDERPPYPQIANAIYVSRSAAYYNALYGQAYAKLLCEKAGGQDAPVVHSYRVYSMRDGLKDDSSSSDLPVLESSTVPVKPILMCFVCKLSFGVSASFLSHCVGEHGVKLSEEEKSTLNTKNCSSILQLVGKEKEPVISFLEPVVKGKEQEREKQTLSPNAIKGLLSAALSQQQQHRNLSGPAGQFPPIRSQHPVASTSGESGQLSQRPPMGLRFFPPPFPIPSMDDKRGDLPTTSAASLLLENLTSAAMLRNSFVESLSRKSPSSSSNLDNGRSGSVSPVTPLGGGLSPMSSLPPSGFASNANMLQGTTIGACPEHINGRQAGVECANCDLILNVSRGGGANGWNAARNTCKTLKCPKCNWHYKYQETLEIHMKEKHPESETTCIYCITGQQHPRLARGETYTCGYKPYRCEVCNYSTTTKGNLSIHMQSDKHLNNMQELQNGGVVPSPEGLSMPQSPGGMGRGNPMHNSPLANINKQKPSWRCDVCNYETGVARNLRIHMTSEKHTHNIMVLQQNVKHMQQQLSHQQPGLPLGPPGMFPGLPGLDPQTMMQLQMSGLGFPPGGGNGGNPGEKPGPPEAAIADIAYLQALMMQMMTGGQFPPGPQPPDFGMLLGGGPGGPGSPLSNLDGGINPDTMEPPPEPPDPNPKNLFNCCVCQEFGCDSLEMMSQHLTMDRSNTREHEVAIIIGTNYICKLCSYKTNLKANFQLHCKTDKHLQRLNHVNHIKEGGPENEWKLKFLTVSNPVQLRCNACDYYTNSLHKLQLHVANQRHEISTILFAHLVKCEQNIPEHRRSYQCSLCKFAVPGKLALMNHVKTIKHLQMEQIHQLQKRSDGNDEQTEIGDIFQVREEESSRSEANDDDDDNDDDEAEQQRNDEESVAERGKKYFSFVNQLK